MNVFAPQRPDGIGKKCQGKSWLIRKGDSIEAKVRCTNFTSPEELALGSQNTVFCFIGHSLHLAAFQPSGYKNIDI